MMVSLRIPLGGGGSRRVVIDIARLARTEDVTRLSFLTILRDGVLDFPRVEHRLALSQIGEHLEACRKDPA